MTIDNGTNQPTKVRESLKQFTVAHPETGKDINLYTYYCQHPLDYIEEEESAKHMEERFNDLLAKDMLKHSN